MCGRFTNQFTWAGLGALYRITEPYIHPASNLEPRYNFALLQRGIVIRLDEEGRREPVVIRWGWRTFTLLTTEPNAPCAPIHDRMPVILGKDEWENWLGTVDDRKALLRPYPTSLMECWEVGQAVGNVRNEGAELVENTNPR
ncbi:MAG: SOS response-associated peptidase family protein [Rhizomicrobium sp.]|jgi:putative SOS response-associated peptidase YedK